MEIISERPAQPGNGILLQERRPRKVKLGFPQLVTVAMLFIFTFQPQQVVDFQIGPLTLTMMIELAAFILVVPWISIYVPKMGRPNVYLFILSLCMLGLSLVNMSGVRGITQQKSIFVSFYAYFFIVIFFSNRPRYDVFLRRLHLFPAIRLIFSVVAAYLSVADRTDLQSRIGVNEVTCFLAFVFPLCWVQFQRERGLFRWLNLFVMMAVPPTILVTASRTGFVIFALVVLAMLLLQRSSKARLLWGLGLLALMAGFLMLPQQSALITRVSTLQDPGGALALDRVALWKAAALAIQRNPILGSNFRANVRQLVMEAAPESNYARHIYWGTTKTNSGVHNGYLAALVDFGIPIGLIYIGWYLALGGALWRTIRKLRNEINRRYLLAGFFCLIGYAIANFTLHIYIGLEYMILWAVLYASMRNALLQEEIPVKK